MRGCGLSVARAAKRACPIPFQINPFDDFIQGREALVRLVRIKARFMRQRELRFARYHKLPRFIKMPGLCHRQTFFESHCAATYRVERKVDTLKRACKGTFEV